MRIEANEDGNDQVLDNQETKVEPRRNIHPKRWSFLPANEDENVNDESLEDLHGPVEV